MAHKSSFTIFQEAQNSRLDYEQRVVCLNGDTSKAKDLYKELSEVINSLNACVPIFQAIGQKYKVEWLIHSYQFLRVRLNSLNK